MQNVEFKIAAGKSLRSKMQKILEKTNAFSININLTFFIEGTRRFGFKSVDYS